MDDLDRFMGANRRTWSANTFDRYQRALRLFLSEIDGKRLARLPASKFLEFLEGHNWGSSSQWIAYTAIRKYLTWRFGADHPALALRIKRAQPSPQRSLTYDQVSQLLTSFDTTTVKGRRDLAICGVMLDCALRASELCSLSVKYLDVEQKTIKVRVKGGRWSLRVFSDYTAAWLSAWLSDRSGLALPGVDQVFISLGGNTPGKGLTREGLQSIMRHWARSIGLPALSPHDFRRTFGSLVTLSGAPEDVAMKGGGWTSHDVFRRYTVGVTTRAVEQYLPTKSVMEKKP